MTADWERFFTEAISEARRCLHLGEDNLRLLAGFQMTRKCKTFFPPTRFGVAQGSMPKDTVDNLDLRSRCHLEHYDRVSRY